MRVGLLTALATSAALTLAGCGSSETPRTETTAASSTVEQEAVPDTPGVEATLDDPASLSMREVLTRVYRNAPSNVDTSAALVEISRTLVVDRSGDFGVCGTVETRELGLYGPELTNTVGEYDYLYSAGVGKFACGQTAEEFVSPDEVLDATEAAIREYCDRVLDGADGTDPEIRCEVERDAQGRLRGIDAHRGVQGNVYMVFVMAPNISYVGGVSTPGPVSQEVMQRLDREVSSWVEASEGDLGTYRIDYTLKSADEEASSVSDYANRVAKMIQAQSALTQTPAGPGMSIDDFRNDLDVGLPEPGVTVSTTGADGVVSNLLTDGQLTSDTVTVSASGEECVIVLDTATVGAVHDVTCAEFDASF